ncbi:MAG: zinc-ribbon domain-containing protein [Lachnospiraceae bacterium]|nr:zinc-ribbon domain-containing protein [Lachnospiraceae bacterium]
MTNCVNCGAPIPEGATFCTNCGTRIIRPEAAGYADDAAYRTGRSERAERAEEPGRREAEPYRTPYENRYAVRDYGEPAEPGVGSWMLTMFLAGIPVVGFIMLLVWALSAGTPTSRKNWAIATLIWSIIGVVLTFFAVFVLGYNIME